MNRIIAFRIFKGEDGFYVAAADDAAIYTQGRTFEDLLDNIKEAVEVSQDDILGEGEGFPPIMMNMDFSEVTHAS